MPIRIIIADDHPVVRRGLMQFIADEDELEVVAECADGESALDAVTRHAPDVLIVDLQMPRLNGMEVLRRLSEMPASPATVLLAGNISDDEVMEAMRMGAKGVVLKEMAPSLLVACIRKVATGATWLEKEAIGRALEKMLRHEQSRQKVREVLTPREIDIVRMVASGLGNREIGEKLFISEGTVKTHLHSVYEKLGLKGRVQLANYAQEKGLT
ncbi:MAG TPA: response regulator transcription factor [Thermoanaerobaculia bacterium]|jgi:DNA-binding NarL/FixJ family response regulator|nr:response regulator transcription factor [Thermoanaerobaculia bacterium]